MRLRVEYSLDGELLSVGDICALMYRRKKQFDFMVLNVNTLLFLQNISLTNLNFQKEQHFVFNCIYTIFFVHSIGKYTAQDAII